MLILLVDDDALAVRATERILGAADILYHSVATGREGLEAVAVQNFDAIILDLTLVDMHGYEMLRRLRDASSMTPVLILSGDNVSETKIEGFGLGADDYLTKPFDRNELVARLHALVRRSRTPRQQVIHTGAIAVDLRAGNVSVDGQPVSMTRTEYGIIELLSLNKGATLSKRTIIRHIYGIRDEPDPRAIDVYIYKLRRKLASASNSAQHCIETVWGEGYALRDPSPSLELMSA